MATQTHEDAAAEGPGLSAPGHEAGAAGAHAGAEAGGHESSGLPQFDFSWWPGQIAWFLIVFFVVMGFMRFFATPKVGGTIEAREAKIAGDIANARCMKDEADAEAKAAAAEAAQARSQAQKLAAEARAKIQAEIAARLGEEEAKLAASGAEAEARIAKARDAAMANVQTIGTETAQAIVEKLSGRAASAGELAQAGRG